MTVFEDGVMEMTLGWTSSTRWIMGLLLAFSACAGQAAVVHVRPDATGTPDGTAWATAYPTVQQGVDGAAPGDEVWVAAGTYTETIVLKSGVKLLGGFLASHTSRDQRDPQANVTILDGGGTFANVIRVSGASADTQIDGFTIRKAVSDGMFCISSSLIVSNNVLTDNGDDGIDIDSGSPLVMNNLIHNNTDDGVDSDTASPTISSNSIYLNKDDGIQVNSASALIIENQIFDNVDDGINTDSDAPVILRNVISDNGDDGVDANFSAAEIRENLITDNGGDGVYAYTASPVITNNVIRDNVDDGIECYISQASITGNLVAGNGTGTGGNGIECYLSRPTITNNTVVDNTGHGVFLINSTPTLVNNVIAYHQAEVAASDASSSAVMRHNCVYNASGLEYQGVPNVTGQDGNLSSEPGFVDRAGGDYHLSSGSVCVDAGDDTVVTAGSRDIDGEGRILGLHVDIGADEYVSGVGYVRADVERALRLTGGLVTAAGSEMARLDVEGGASAGVVNLVDAVRLARKAAGTDSQP